MSLEARLDPTATHLLAAQRPYEEFYLYDDQSGRSVNASGTAETTHDGYRVAIDMERVVDFFDSLSGSGTVRARHNHPTVLAHPSYGKKALEERVWQQHRPYLVGRKRGEQKAAIRQLAQIERIYGDFLQGIPSSQDITSSVLLEAILAHVRPERRLVNEIFTRRADGDHMIQYGLAPRATERARDENPAHVRAIAITLGQAYERELLSYIGQTKRAGKRPDTREFLNRASQRLPIYARDTPLTARANFYTRPVLKAA